MKKIFLSLCTLFVIIFASGCDNEKPVIIYNKYPFSEETLPAQTNVFKPDDKIYYLITLPQPIESKMLYIQILKCGSADRYGYELVWGKKVHLKSEQVHYYTDYVILNSAGTYEMRVYSQDNPTKLLTGSEFYLK